MLRQRLGTAAHRETTTEIDPWVVCFATALTADPAQAVLKAVATRSSRRTLGHAQFVFSRHSFGTCHLHEPPKGRQGGRLRPSARAVAGAIMLASSGRRGDEEPNDLVVTEDVPHETCRM